MAISQKFERGKLAQSFKGSHPMRQSNGSFSSTSQIIKNIRDEENLRQCEQLLHELQEEIPDSLASNLNNSSHHSKSRGQFNLQQNCQNLGGNLTQRSMSLRQSASLSNLRRSMELSNGINNVSFINNSSSNQNNGTNCNQSINNNFNSAFNTQNPSGRNNAQHHGLPASSNSLRNSNQNLQSTVLQFRDFRSKLKKNQPGQQSVQNLRQSCQDFKIPPTLPQNHNQSSNHSKRQSLENSNLQKLQQTSSVSHRNSSNQRNQIMNKKGVLSTSINLCDTFTINDSKLQPSKVSIQPLYSNKNQVCKSSYFSNQTSIQNNISNMNDASDSLQISMGQSEVGNNLGGMLQNQSLINGPSNHHKRSSIHELTSKRNSVFVDEDQATLKSHRIFENQASQEFDTTQNLNYQSTRTQRNYRNLEYNTAKDSQNLEQTTPNTFNRKIANDLLNQNTIDSNMSPTQLSRSQPRRSVIGQTSSTILMLDKQLSQLQRENRELKEQLENSHKQQHDLENEIEEYLVETRRKEEETKQVKKRFQDFQKSHVNCEKERKDLTEKLIKVEKEKLKINDKYIKLSQRLKEGGTSSRDETQAKIKEYQQLTQKQAEDINQLTSKLHSYEMKLQKQQTLKCQDFLSQESDQSQRIFERFSSELVCACLHELMLELSQKMSIQGDETFDIAKFQQFLREQNCKECGHADLIDLELGSIIVLACKRIKDLIYLVDELSEKFQMTNTQLGNATQQLIEKSQQLENMQQNLMSMLQLNLPNGQMPIQGTFFNGQNTMTSSQIFKHMNFQTGQTLGTQNTIDESPQANFARKFSTKHLAPQNQSNATILQQSMQNPSFLHSSTGNHIIGKENWNNDNQINQSHQTLHIKHNQNLVYRNQKLHNQKNTVATGRSQSPIDFGGTSAIHKDCSPDQTGMISRDVSLLNYNSNNMNVASGIGNQQTMSRQPSHQTLLSKHNQNNQKKVL